MISQNNFFNNLSRLKFNGKDDENDETDEDKEEIEENIKLLDQTKNEFEMMGVDDEPPTKSKFEKDITDEIKRKIKERFSSKGSSDNRENEEEDRISDIEDYPGFDAR